MKIFVADRISPWVDYLKKQDGFEVVEATVHLLKRLLKLPKILRLSSCGTPNTRGYTDQSNLKVIGRAG